MTLAIYVARRFLRSFLIVALSFFGILFLIEMVEKIRSFGADQIGLGRTAILAALSVPNSFYTILPLIVAMAAMLLFIGLARSSELVAIRASGRSGLRIVMAPVAVALILGILAVTVGNPIASATAKRYEELANRYHSGAQQTVSIGASGVWMRQGMGTPDGAQAVIEASRANLDATKLYGVTFLIFAPNRGPIRRIDAAEAILEPGHWRLNRIKEWPLDGTVNPERAVRSADTLDLATDLTAARIRDSFGTPSAVPVWKLPSFIKGLEEAGFSARRHLVWFEMELALPLIFAAMVMMSAAFTMGHARFGRIGAMSLLALGAALAIFFLRNIAQVLGENGQIPVSLAAWAPPAIALMLSTALMLSREDG